MLPGKNKAGEEEVVKVVGRGSVGGLGMAWHGSLDGQERSLKVGVMWTPRERVSQAEETVCAKALGQELT